MTLEEYINESKIIEIDRYPTKREQKFRLAEIEQGQWTAFYAYSPHAPRAEGKSMIDAVKNLIQKQKIMP